MIKPLDIREPKLRARQEAVVEARKPLTRRETIELAVRQLGLCGCGCGVKLNALAEGCVDEHVIALGLTGANDLANRSLWRKPCSAKKTPGDQTKIAKAKRIADREINGPKPPKLKSAGRKIQSRGFDKSRTRHFDNTVTKRGT